MPTEEGSFDTQAPPGAPRPRADRRQRGRALVFRLQRERGAGRTTVAAVNVLPSARLTVAALVGADLCALLLAGLIGVATTPAVGQQIQLAAAGPLAAMATLFGFAFLASGLYPAAGLDRVEELRRMVLVAVGSGLALTAATLAGAVFGRNVAALVPALVASTLLVVLAPLLRAVIRHVGGSRPWWGVPVVVLGARSAAAGLVASLQRSPDLGLRPIACFSDDVGEHGLEVAGVPIVGRFADARHYRSVGVRHALVVDPGSGGADLAAVTAHARGFPSLTVVPLLDDRATVDVAWNAAGGSAIPRRVSTRSRHHDVVKRAIDLALIVPASIVAAPLVAICAVAVAAMSPGNPFYFQAREGRGGRTIRVWKLRTMHQNAEALLERYLNENPVARTEWERRFKLADDPRILPGVGTFLRRTSLDELPQLWCIARGDMSFVGPRPFPSYHLAAFGAAFRELRRSVPPGLTGLWQVSGRSEVDVHLQEELDTHYIHNWSLWMDLYVLVRTPVAVLLGKGAS